MRAFAGESQARNRYTFAAAQARAVQLELLAQVFLFTAEQERAHAKVFYEHLRQLAGQTITVDGTYPVDLSQDLGQLLQLAQHNELEEFDKVYPAFAKTAQQEGFEQVAASFQRIAQVEHMHANRFQHIAQLVQQNQLTGRSDGELWMCLNCGHVHRGGQAPGQCPVCQYGQGYFSPVELAPWTC